MQRGSILTRIVTVVWVLLFLEALAGADQIDDLARQVRSGGDYKVRLSAALNLVKLGKTKRDSRVVPPLIDALRDSDKTVRGVAAGGLKDLVAVADARTRDRALSELDRVRRTDSDGFVKSQAEKAYQTAQAGGGGGVPSGRKAVYVEVGPMSDGTKKGGTQMLGVMRSTVESTINKKAPAFSTRWPSGRSPSRSELSSAGTKAAFYVDGTLTTLDTKKSGSMAEVSCNVSLIIASFPDKSMFGFLKGGAAVQTSTSDRAIDEAKSDCVGAVLEDLVARQVVPTIEGRVP
jgi:hypothetical protein